MVHITKKEVKAFGEITESWPEELTATKNSWATFFYHGEPMNKWLLFRFRFALWRMKTFRLFRKPLGLRDDAVK